MTYIELYLLTATPHSLYLMLITIECSTDKLKSLIRIALRPTSENIEK